MKIIEKGDGRKGWAIEYRCTDDGNGNGGCGALLLVEERDLYKTYHYDYGGGKDVFITFRCPECNNQTDVKDVPSNINVRSEDPSKYDNSEK